MQITINEQTFDDILDRTERVQMDKDDYIPSEEEIDNYIEPHPERYYIYLLWFSEHKPKPQTEEEKKRIKRIITIINHTIQITEEEGGTCI